MIRIAKGVEGSRKFRAQADTVVNGSDQATGGWHVINQSTNNYLGWFEGMTATEVMAQSPISTVVGITGNMIIVDTWQF